MSVKQKESYLPAWIYIDTTSMAIPMLYFISSLICLTILIFSMRVSNIERFNKWTHNPSQSRKENYWIREMGTAKAYSCNEKIDGVSILSSLQCSSVDVKKHL